MALTPEQLKSIQETLRRASAITGIPVNQPAQQPTASKQKQIDAMSAQVEEMSKKATQIGEQMNVLSKAKETGMDVSGKTTVEEARQYIQPPAEREPEMPTRTPTYEPPSTTATETIDKYTQTLIAQEQKTRETLEKRYQAELDRLTTEKETAQKKADELLAKTEGVITEEVKPLLQPFREDIEKKERERLKIEENYFANQRLTDELDSLLTQIQADVQATKNITGLASIREPRISKATEDAMARVGVIEAVMAARNKQINVGYSLIDRTVNAIEADRKDQLNYYNTLISFYDKQRDEEGNKIFNIEKEEKEFINAQIGLLENDLAQAQTNADYIKSLMINPDTAQFIADAGITLNDTPEGVNAKMAEQSRKEQVVDFTNKLKAQGYDYVAYPADKTDLVSYEVGGQTLWFKPPEEPVEEDELLSVTEAKSLGVPYGTTKAQAAAMGKVPGGGGEDITFTDKETGEEMDKWEAARSIVEKNPRASENELVNSIRGSVVDKNGKSLLSVGDTQRVVREEKKKILPQPPNVIADSLVAANFEAGFWKNREDELIKAKEKAIDILEGWTIGQSIKIGENIVTLTEEIKKELIDAINAISVTRDEANRIKSIKEELEEE